MRARTVILVGVVVVMVAGCQTTQPVWFIATPGYVEARIATHEHALRRAYDDRISGLEQELDSQRRVSDELASLSQVIREVEADNRELLILASELDRALQDLPAHTIQAIVNALAGYLESLE